MYHHIKKPMYTVRVDDADPGPLIAIAGGGGVNLFNSLAQPLGVRFCWREMTAAWRNGN